MATFTFSVERLGGEIAQVELYFAKSTEITVANLRNRLQVGDGHELQVFVKAKDLFIDIKEEDDLGNSFVLFVLFVSFFFFFFFSFF
jgi:hypothetical protein